MDRTREAAIRARAYQLWIEGGYADGHQDRHWRQAEREVDERARVGNGVADEDAATAGRVLADAAPHSDGTSRHPSVLDPGTGRSTG